MWRYCILIYEYDDYVLQVSESGIEIGSDVSVARFFKTVEELHDYARNACNLDETKYGVKGYYEKAYIL